MPAAASWIQSRPGGACAGVARGLQRAARAGHHLAGIVHRVGDQALTSGSLPGAPAGPGGPSKPRGPVVPTGPSGPCWPGAPRSPGGPCSTLRRRHHRRGRVAASTGLTLLPCSPAGPWRARFTLLAILPSLACGPGSPCRPRSPGGPCAPRSPAMPSRTTARRSATLALDARQGFDLGGAQVGERGLGLRLGELARLTRTAARSCATTWPRISRERVQAMSRRRS